MIIFNVRDFEIETPYIALVNLTTWINMEIITLFYVTNGKIIIHSLNELTINWN